MAGNTANAALWQNADVYIAPVETAGPTDLTTAWGASWDAVGLLDGAEGFVESREAETSEHYAWGGILVKKTKSKHQRKVKFVALEDNDTVFELANPGSTRETDGTSGITTSTVKVPTNTEFAIGFEARDGTKVHRRIVKRATVDEVGDIKESEEELTVFEVTVALYPEADGTLYTSLSGDTA